MPRQPDRRSAFAHASNLAAPDCVGKIAGNALQNRRPSARLCPPYTAAPLMLLDAWIGIAAQTAVAYPAH